MAELLNFTRLRRLKTVLQTEASECGLACLTMVANYHGHDFTMLGMRRRFSTSLKGMTLERMVEIASQLSLSPRPVKAELESLSSLPVPAILHWDMDHYVVLEKVTRNGLHIIDPAFGARFLKHEEASKHFTGVALELKRSNRFEKQESRAQMRLSEFWRSLIGLKRALAQLFILSFIIQIIVLLMPLQTQLIIDEVLVKFDYDLLVLTIVGFSLIVVVHKATSALRGFVVMYFGNVFFYQVMTNLFGHLLKLPTSYFEKAARG